jgi:HAD superfamily hydrolase (TIGR01450 family)
MPLDFSPYQAVLLDLDGTVYHEDHALPGAIELIKRLQQEQRTFACLSNSSASPLRIMARLELMGVDIDPSNIYTAAAAACDYVIEKFGAGDRKARVFNLATESVDEMLQGLVDLVSADADGSQPCDAIIVGPPSSVMCTEERQRVALSLARSGAAIVGVCADREYPSPRGIEFGAGAMAWMLAYASNSEPVFCGKPEKIFFHELCQRLNVAPEWCLLIGDNLESDIMGGKSVGMRTVLTLSGVTRDSDLSRVKSDMQPDLVVQSLTEL